MNEKELATWRKTAQIGLAAAASPNRWHEVALMLAKRKAFPGETPECAFARLSLIDPEIKNLDQMRRKAAGRPTHRPLPNVAANAAEDALAAMAQRLAKAEGISFEQAFVRAIDTPEGAKLYRDSKR